MANKEKNLDIKSELDEACKEFVREVHTQPDMEERAYVLSGDWSRPGRVLLQGREGLSV